MHLLQLVVDDFLPNPMVVREKALSLTYPPRPERAQYPGRNANQPLKIQGLEQEVCNLVREPLSEFFDRRSSYGVPRLALAGETARNNVHIDPVHWSGILFLSLDEHCEGGTHFFKHKRTGWDRAPVFDNEAQKFGYKSWGDATDDLIMNDGPNPDAWEKTTTIPMKFNRLVLFRGYMFHDAGHSFGTTPESGRLIIPYFFENAHAGRN